MGKVTGFKEFERQDEKYVSVKDRVQNYKEFTVPLSEKELTKQGSRCMDCGIPFCHSGCPLGNLIPDFNHMVHQGEWQKASWILHSTNNFPEFTGRLCPAPCEKSCVLGIIEDPVSIENIEKNIVERAFKEGWIKPQPPKFKTNINVGVNYDVSDLKSFDAVVLCGGATERRSLPTPGIDADGVVQAMDFLTQQTKTLFGKEVKDQVMATDKNVIVIGGGDTGSDCIGTSNRHGAKSVVNFEIMPKPPGERSPQTPWPYWPLQLKTSSSHQEGAERNWLINTKEFVKDNDGKLIALKTVNVEWKIIPGQRPQLVEIDGTEKTWPCDLALLALGFTGPESTLADKLGLEKDNRSNYKAEYGKYQTNIPNIFTAGDMRRGQSLIVWAISEGREAARQVDLYLMGKSELPSKDVTGDLIAM